MRLNIILHFSSDHFQVLEILKQTPTQGMAPCQEQHLAKANRQDLTEGQQLFFGYRTN